MRSYPDDIEPSIKQALGQGYEPFLIMLEAGLEWLEYDKNRDPEFGTIKSMPGELFSGNSDADELNDIMVERAEDHGFRVSTGLTNIAITHVVMANSMGWDKYVEAARTGLTLSSHNCTEKDDG